MTEALKTIPAGNLTHAVALPSSQNPAAVYLARLGSHTSRITMSSTLDQVARLICSDERAEALKLDWPALRYQHIQAIRSKLTEVYAPATCNKYLAALRGVLKECWRLGLISAEDYERVRDVAPVKGERLLKGRSLTPRELKALFQVFDSSTAAGARNAALLAVLYAAGLRRSEVVALSLGDWSSAEASLKVRGKGNKDRLVYLNNGALEALEAWLEVRGQGEVGEPLFVGINKSDKVSSRRLTSQAIYQLVGTFVEKAGIDSFSPHDLRRSFISDLLDAGADITTVQRMAGHSKIETTSRYDRRGETAKARAATLLKVPYAK